MKFATVATLTTALAVLVSLAVQSDASAPAGQCQRLEHEVLIQDLDPSIITGGKVDVGECFRSDAKYACVPTGYRNYNVIIKLPQGGVTVRTFVDLIIEDCHAVLVATTPKPEKPATEKP